MFERFIPKLVVDSIREIDLDFLRNNGIRGIITDLDNTLVGAREPDATPEVLEWLKRLDEYGFRIVIVSNNHLPRVERFAKPLGIPFLHRAKKPTRTPFRKALALLQLTSEQVAVVGDQLMTDIYGGNRLGMFTILVNPIAPQDEGFGTRINRRLEKIVRAFTRRS
jgi:hypothetical protein